MPKTIVVFFSDKSYDFGMPQPKRSNRISPIGLIVIFSFIFFMLGAFTGLRLSGAAKTMPDQSNVGEFSTQADDVVELDPNYQIPKHPNDSMQIPDRAEIRRREAEALKYLKAHGIQLQHPMPSATSLSPSDRKLAEEIYNSGTSDEVEITITPE